jgi:Dna[CI] antecedent DciA-like protein
VDKLGKILPRVIARTPNRGRIVEAHVRTAFAAVLGEELASMCDSIELRGAVLSVRTSNPALAHQLTADTTRLLERLNDLALGRTVSKLQVRTGRPAR